jgi:predicted transcriptional regulator
MFENKSCNSVSIKKINKYLCKTEGLFLNRLYFWSSHRKSYGIEKDGRVWIYNTLDNWSDQIGVSKSSIRRAIKSLKDKKIIDSNYLSANKRNRTLYYSINFDGINDFLLSIKSSSCVQKNNISNRINEHLDEHMYIEDNSKQIINKSYKSEKDSYTKTHDTKVNSTEFNETKYEKPTIIQDMLKIWNEEFSNSNIQLTKSLARFLVAAFKTKFKSCLKEWKKYLKTLKTSTFIMSEKFKLSVWWVIKFITIDRIRAGELGAKPESVVTELEDLTEKAKDHIKLVKESEKCKDFRKKIMKIMKPSIYVSWFTKVDFEEINGRIVMKAHNSFVEDWIMRNFGDQFR